MRRFGLCQLLGALSLALLLADGFTVPSKPKRARPDHVKEPAGHADPRLRLLTPVSQRRAIRRTPSGPARSASCAMPRK